MKQKSKHPDWVLAHRRPKTEIRFLNGKYYLYEATSKWDPAKKRSQKISGKLLGKITPEGFIESDKHKLRSMGENTLKNPPSIKEYGASNFVLTYLSEHIEKLKINFPDLWKDIVSLSIIRLLYQTPIKNTGFFFEKSYLSEIYYDIKLGEKRTSALYRKFGTMREQSISYMKSFFTKDDYILIDATNIVSFSERIGISHIGYNTKQDYDPQINLMLMFSSKKQTPMYFRVIPGNIREVGALRLSLDECGVENATIVADKGFFSEQNIQTLDSLKLQYIIPLRRSSEMIDYSHIKEDKMEEFFTYQNRHIWHCKYRVGEKTVHLFHDTELRMREEKDYLTRIHSHPETYSLAEFKTKKTRFGSIALFTNKNKNSSQEIYEDYKVRNQVETMIDAMKNTLMADSSNMQNEDAFNGWMLINFIALQFYYCIYMLLKEKGQINKYSPQDLIKQLAEVRKVKINQKWITAEVHGKTKKLLEKLDLEPIT